MIKQGSLVIDVGIN